jgi:hypothetical protein
VIHQASYIRTFLLEFEQRHNQGNALKSVTTPMRTDKDIPDDKVPEWMSDFSGECNEWIGKLLWVARGCRMDISNSVCRLSRRLSKWDRRSDLELYRLMQYLKNKETLGLMMIADSQDFDRLIVSGDVDADWGGDVYTGKSTSGAITVVKGPNTFVPLEWFSRTQQAASQSSGEAEIVAIHEGTYRSIVPLTTTLEKIFMRKIVMCLGSDATAAISALYNGYSKKLAYILRTQKVSLDGLHEIWYNPEENNVVRKVPTEKNRGDLFTKPLDAIKFWFMLERVGMKFINE